MSTKTPTQLKKKDKKDSQQKQMSTRQRNKLNKMVDPEPKTPESLTEEPNAQIHPDTVSGSSQIPQKDLGLDPRSTMHSPSTPGRIINKDILDHKPPPYKENGGVSQSTDLSDTITTNQLTTPQNQILSAGTVLTPQNQSSTRHTSTPASDAGSPNGFSMGVKDDENSPLDAIETYHNSLHDSTNTNNRPPITLETLNTSINRLTDALLSVRTEAADNQYSQQLQIENLEQRMDKKHADLKASVGVTIATKFTTVNQDLHAKTTAIEKNQKDIQDLKDCMNYQSKQIDDQSKLIAEMKTQLALGDLVARREARTAMTLVNDLESHSRKWSVRILGLPTPPKKESPDECKDLIIDFFKTRLNINSISTLDLDCAHRLGDSVDGKQTILMRFFARDQADLVTSRRKLLKDTPFVIFGDATLANRRLLNALNRKKDTVHSAWIINGIVWAKRTQDGPKVRITIHDNLDTLFTGP